MSAPTWVRTPDGGLEPFDADRIARRLFAAGMRDALACRELTDAVVHFLAAECEGTPTTAEVAEAVARTVRELGQPALARAYEERRPAAADTGVYSADVRAAHEAGLIGLMADESPDHLQAVVLADPDGREDGLARAIRRAREAAWDAVAIDGLEYARGANDLSITLHETGLRGLMNVNVAPPPWADFNLGPLFASADPEAYRERAVNCVANLMTAHYGRGLDVRWHLGPSDLGWDGGLEAVCEHILREPSDPTVAGLDGWYPSGDASISIVFDRPRRPVALGGGLSQREHPAVLTCAALNLVALADQPGLLADVDRYVHLLGSLARLALSAAVQKREHLRRQNRPAITGGFLLDRARFVAEAQGLDEVVKRFTGWSLANGGPSLDLGKRIVQRLVDVLRQEGRALQLETFLGGLTPDAPGASIRSQMQAAGALHAIAEGGTLRLHLVTEAVHTAASLAEELRRAWRETAVGRVEVVR